MILIADMAGERLDAFVARCADGLTRSAAQKLIEEGAVTRNGRPGKKNDKLGDPLMDEYHAVAMKLATKEEIETIKKYAFGVNEQLKTFWAECGVTLVDFKLEFGKLSDGTIVLADEISPDTCRLWDSKTGEKLDKDRFRRDLGGVEDAYAEVMKRLSEHI